MAIHVGTRATKKCCFHVHSSRGLYSSQTSEVLSAQSNLNMPSCLALPASPDFCKLRRSSRPCATLTRVLPGAHAHRLFFCPSRWLLITFIDLLNNRHFGSGDGDQSQRLSAADHNLGQENRADKPILNSTEAQESYAEKTADPPRTHIYTQSSPKWTYAKLVALADAAASRCPCRMNTFWNSVTWIENNVAERCKFCKQNVKLHWQVRYMQFLSVDLQTLRYRVWQLAKTLPCCWDVWQIAAARRPKCERYAPIGCPENEARTHNTKELTPPETTRRRALRFEPTNALNPNL